MNEKNFKKWKAWNWLSVRFSDPLRGLIYRISLLHLRNATVHNLWCHTVISRQIEYAYAVLKIKINEWHLSLFIFHLEKKIKNRKWYCISDFRLSMKSENKKTMFILDFLCLVNSKKTIL